MKRFSLIGLAGLAAANVIPKELSLNRPPKILDATINAANLGSFEQLIDHDNPSLGTFSQRFWYSDEFWAGPGSPVVFFTPGEVEASGYTGYLTNKTITGLFAQAVGGAVVMMERTMSPENDRERRADQRQIATGANRRRTTSSRPRTCST